MTENDKYEHNNSWVTVYLQIEEVLVVVAVSEFKAIHDRWLHLKSEEVRDAHSCEALGLNDTHIYERCHVNVVVQVQTLMKNLAVPGGLFGRKNIPFLSRYVLPVVFRHWVVFSHSEA
jgi:hypothetical protein